MRTTERRALTLLALPCLFAFAGLAPADDKDLKKDEIPAKVKAAVKAKFPKAQLKKAMKEEEDGKVSYEFEMTQGGKGLDLAVSASGKITEVEREIDADDLPKAVLATLSEKYKGAKVTKAEAVERTEEDDEDEVEKTFELTLTSKGGKTVEVVMSPKGKVLDPKKADEGDEKDEKKAKKGDKDDDDDKAKKGEKDDDDDDKKAKKGEKDDDDDDKKAKKGDKDDDDDDKKEKK